MAFEYRDAWIAIGTESVDAVLAALDSRSLRECTWIEGAAQSFSTARKTIFVSAPVDGEIWCAGQRFFELIHGDEQSAAAYVAALEEKLGASVRIPRETDVMQFARAEPAGIIAREHWTAPPLTGSSLPEPPAPQEVSMSSILIQPSYVAAESAARGSAIARWILEASIVLRSARVTNSPDPYRSTYQSPMDKNPIELILVAAVIIAFELAVFFANRADARLDADQKARFRIRMTRLLVTAAGAGIAGSALYANDAFLLMAGVFVAIAGFIAASYIPDALFGGSKPVYD